MSFFLIHNSAALRRHFLDIL